MPEWMTLEELSRYLKLSKATLYKRAQAGEIPAVKLGRGWRFNRDTIDDWLRRSQTRPHSEFPWDDCLQSFIKQLRTHFGKRWSSLWIYGSWARGEAEPDSDVDLLVVLKMIPDWSQDFATVATLAYAATFGRDRPIVFSTTVTDEKTFLAGMEPLLLNVRHEGHRAA